jgi:FimV-like protein
MRKRAGHKFALVWIAASLLLLTGNAQAVSLGKIEVTSFLGESLYAEISLKLDADESLTKVVVEIASASEYKIYEVFRDQVLKSIRTDVVSDSRGTRVELSSRNKLKSPYFNLVLKTQYGRVTHFKKFPVFLEPPKSIRSVAKRKPLPSVKASLSPLTEQPQVTSKAVAAKAQDSAAPVLASHDGWTRTGRYGPIVRGDTLSTVARRLRIDHRYNLHQVMVALFEKNKSKFNQDNMNLLKAGSYLDVPKAAEVERLSKSQARGVLADHEKRWEELTKQPRFAAEKEAQRTRYSKRVHVGQRAGSAIGSLITAPVKMETAQTTETPSATAVKTKSEASDSGLVPEPAAQKQVEETDVLLTTKTTGLEAAQDTTAESDSSALIASLKKKNAELRIALEENEKQINLKIASATRAANKASETAIAKLEVMVAQLQNKLEEVRQEAQSNQDGNPSWMISLLYGLIVVLLGVVALLLLRRREPAHPAVAVKKLEIKVPAVIPEAETESAPKEPEQADVETTAPVDTEIDREIESFSETRPVENDELIVTDTVEIEPGTAISEETPTPDVNHLSDADMYIRYGMEDEALQQLDMALHSQPDNVEAHIKKVEVLRSSNNSKGLEEAIVVAGSVLAGIALERFNAVIADFNDSEAFTAIENSNMNVEDKIEVDEPDGDIPDVAQADSDDVTWQSETIGLDDTGEEIEWLNEVPLASDDFLTIEEGEQQSADSENQEAPVEEAMDMGAEGSVEELDNLLSEFSGDDDDVWLDESTTEQAAQESLGDPLANDEVSGDELDGTIDWDAHNLDNQLKEPSDDEDEKKE